MTVIEEVLQKLRAHNKRLSRLEKIEKPIKVGVMMETNIAQTIPATTYTIINYNIIYDPLGVLTGVSIIARKDAWIQITMIARTADTIWKNKDEWEIVLMRNGAFDSLLGSQIFQGVITAQATINGAGSIFVSRGDLLEFAVRSTIATVLSGTSPENKISILVIS